MAKLFKIAALIPLIFAMRALLQLGMKTFIPRNYVFDSARLQAIVKESINELSIDASAETIMDSVHAKLKSEYPDYIADISKDQWVFNNAGNAMGSMVILHASLTEYLIFFGSAVGGGGGHSGAHLADDYFTILYGEELAARPWATKPERYLPGDQHWLPYGTTKQYRMPEGSFALELAQGYIPLMLPFGFIEVLTTTLDFETLIKTVKLSAQHMIGNMLKGKF